MKNSVFYSVAITLVLVSIICLIVSGNQARPTEFLGIFIGILVIASILLVIEEGWGAETFLYLLPIFGVSTLIIGLVAAWTNASLPHPAANENFNTVVILGIRWVSLIWPLAVLVIGANQLYDKSQEEKAKAKN